MYPGSRNITFVAAFLFIQAFLGKNSFFTDIYLTWIAAELAMQK